MDPLLLRRQIFPDQISEGHSTAAGHSGRQVRIGVCKIAAGVIAVDIEARDRIAGFVQRVAVHINLDAVHRAEGAAGIFAAIERSCIHRGQAVGLFSEVRILTGIVELIRLSKL